MSENAIANRSQIVRVTHRSTVALIRGEALNPFELQAYAPLSGEFDLLGIGRTRPVYEVEHLPMPTILLGSVASSRVLRAAHRRAPVRLRQRIDLDKLIGLRAAVQGRQILHAAETVLPVSEQAARICANSTSRLVLTCWETIPFRYDDDPLLAARKRIVREHTSHYIAVTRRARQALLEEGVSPNSISVVPAAVDSTRFTSQQGLTAFREEWGLSASHRIVLYVGRLIQEKGIVELVRAFARMKNSNARLVIVGNGNQSGRIHVAARALGVADQVLVRTGLSYDRLPELYNSVDLVVAPSLTTPYWEEQFGMVLAEAMACGRPLLTTASGAIPEVVGNAAHLVEPYDNDALTSGLAALLDDETYRAELGARARRRALERYAVGQVAPQLAAVYRNVLAE